MDKDMNPVMWKDKHSTKETKVPNDDSLKDSNHVSVFGMPMKKSVLWRRQLIACGERSFQSFEWRLPMKLSHCGWNSQVGSQSNHRSGNEVRRSGRKQIRRQMKVQMQQQGSNPKMKELFDVTRQIFP